MAVPTLETDGAAAILRITDGTSGDPVTWNDVWEWGAGGGAGLVPLDGGGTARVDTFITEVVADAVYTIEKDIWFGNAGGDASYFTTIHELIQFASGFSPEIKGNATFQMGELEGNYGINGSHINIMETGNWDLLNHADAVFKMYASSIFLGTVRKMSCSLGTVYFYDSIINGHDRTASARMNFNPGMAGIFIYRLSMFNVTSFTWATMPDVVEGLIINYTEFGIIAYGATVVTGAGISEYRFVQYITTGDIETHLVIIDPVTPTVAVRIDRADSDIIEQYTCNIHVTDKNGVGLVGVNIECIEVGGAQEFSVNTDGAGDIVEQTIDYKMWAGLAEILTDYSPHQFILTKAGYKPLYLDEITVDHPLVWELEMPEAVGAYAGAWK